MGARVCSQGCSMRVPHRALRPQQRCSGVRSGAGAGGLSGLSRSGRPTVAPRHAVGATWWLLHGVQIWKIRPEMVPGQHALGTGSASAFAKESCSGINELGCHHMKGNVLALEKPYKESPWIYPLIIAAFKGKIARSF